MLLGRSHRFDGVCLATLCLLWGAVGALADQTVAASPKNSHHDADHHDHHHGHHHSAGGGSGWLWLLIPLVLLFAGGIIVILFLISIRLARMEVVVTRTISGLAQRAYGKAMGRAEDDESLERWKKHDGDDEYVESDPDLEYGPVEPSGGVSYAPDLVDPHTGGTFTVAPIANGGSGPAKDKKRLYNHKRSARPPGPAISAEDKRRLAAAQAFKKIRRQQYEDRLKAAQQSVEDSAWLPERAAKPHTPTSPGHVVDLSKEAAVRKRGRPAALPSETPTAQ